jgi:cytochrome oxidase Cu insertion factor (SCO1/SenC/PrrC family)
MRPLLIALAPILLALVALLSGPGCGGHESGLLSKGSTAPDVTVIGMDDQPLALSSLRGRTVLLNFWFYH